MKNIITLILILAVSQTQASWSGFAPVTHETQEKYDINVKITTVKNIKNTYSIEFNIPGSSRQHAWLVISSSTLTENEQKLRNSMWFKKPTNNKIISITKLKPTIKNNENQYKENISASQLKSGYIYIDFPVIVKDGGYYYSIDLKTYYLQHEKIANNCINADRFYTPRHFVLLCVKPSGYAGRWNA